ncbi:hypothetical protein EYR40_008087 [Pleurotus pulmonarius]|nr:hypothetical protein EYR36_008930 [Pleurotus pulmonarius]KAF4596228.1 hypothetical protein EYR38_007605 [Pleurotus pulmonarius]KAF4597625.1 hypothetical protein EYR40_008087 [Pleurotus pulmonarius]
MPPTIDNVKVTALTAPTVAMVVTVVRIIERIRTKRWGVDDSFASLATAMLLVFVVGMFVHLGDPTNKTRTTAIALSYVLPQLFYGVLWSTRLSILFSIVRITPDYIMRRILYGLAVAFCVCWAILFSQVFWVCESQPAWKEAIIPQCPLGQDVAIAQLITDVFADLSLIAIPTKLLWNLRVSRSQRIRLLLTFSTSIITTVVSLVHAFYVLRVGGLEELIAAIVENSVSLIVCNSAVLVTAIMQLFRKGSMDDSTGKITSRGTRTGTVSYGITSVPPPPIHYQGTGKASDALKHMDVDSDSPYTSYHGKVDSQGGSPTVIHVTQEHVALVDLPQSKGGYRDM